jgi:hypothetical protein
MGLELGLRAGVGVGVEVDIISHAFLHKPVMLQDLCRTQQDMSNSTHAK